MSDVGYRVGRVLSRRNHIRLPNGGGIAPANSYRVVAVFQGLAFTRYADDLETALGINAENMVAAPGGYVVGPGGRNIEPWGCCDV